ncbi:MAG: hypothetical protein II793_03440 [Bacteroidales bacterium]|nr:hypothetical protein [Bacteroidales bacterium]
MKHWVVLTNERLMIDGAEQSVVTVGGPLLTDLYRGRIADYPKFFKMDPLCKAGFVASELLLNAESESGGVEQRAAYGTDSRAVILFGRDGSLASDTRYQATIQDPDNYFPSPAIFVYTLPNIITGEIAIRNKYYGETNFIALREKNAEAMLQYLQAAFCDGATQSVLTGWVDCSDENHFDARMGIIHKEIVNLQNISTLLS